MSVDTFDVLQPLVENESSSTLAAQATLGTSSHHNVVTLNGDAIRSIAYIDRSFAISSGQPFELPPAISHNGSTWSIDAYCGRHKTESVAVGFNGLCGGPDHLYGPGASSDKQPAELNFYLGVRVQVRVGADDLPLTLYFAQGSNAWGNNWWLGSDGLANHNGQVLIPVVGPDGTLRQVFAVSSSSDNAFQLSPWF